MPDMPEGTQSILRALRVLKLFDDENPTWDLHELTQATDLNKSTLFRILAALEYESLVEKRDNGRYVLGSEIIALGGRAARVNRLRDVSQPVLQQLTRSTGETTTLEVLKTDHHKDLSYMLVIDEVIGNHIIGITQYIGQRLPVHATSTGKAVLAHVDDALREQIFQQQMTHFTDETRTTPAQVNDDLATIKKRGYAVVASELEHGLVAIGVPVFNADGLVQAAISLSGPTVRIKQTHVSHLAEAVLEAAQEISHRLGYRN
jgi:DNA-binding IclR family transcriptional regulator